MAYQDNNGGSDRQMYQGNWKCSECGADITELPFQPDPSREGELKCRDCHRKGRPERRPAGGGNRFGGERKTYQGNWTCSKCGTAITELPFNPDPSRTGDLLCRECHRANRPPRY